MKPTTPMHGGQHSHLKPTTPMHGSNHPKQAHSRPQRRHRFQLAHLTGPQRRHRFHGQPANATGDTTTKPHTDLHETHNTRPDHGGQHSHLKPTTPMHGSNRPKQAHSRPQRRRGFHGQPANATGDTTTKPSTPVTATYPQA